MDAQARDTWYRSLEYDNFPEISEENILSTFEQLHRNKDEVFERGVINVFRGLSWDYKTNCPCKFGSKNYRQQSGEVGPVGIASYHRAAGRSTCRPGKNAAPVQRQTDPGQPGKYHYSAG